MNFDLIIDYLLGFLLFGPPIPKNLIRAAFFEGLTDKYPEIILYTILAINNPIVISTIYMKI